MPARGGSARLGKGSLKPVPVTLLPDTEQPPFPGRARRPENARAGSLLTGYHEFGQMPAPVREGAQRRGV